MQPIVDQAVQQSVPYNYIVDGSGRAMQYQADTPIVSYSQNTGSPPPMPDYPRHSSAPMAPSAGYASYQPQAEYMAPSPHDEPGMPMMQPQPQHLIYNMQQNMKSDHHPLKSV